MASIKRGDVIELDTRNHEFRGPKHRAYLVRTEREIKALHDADARAGRWCDDGGEPIMYGNISAVHDRVIKVTVTSLRVKPGLWNAWSSSKPKFLRTGWCEELKRDVLFVWE